MRKSVKVLLISILSIVLIFSFSNVVKAAEGDFVEIESYNTTENTNVENTNTNTTENTNTNTTNTNTDTEIPKTGVVEDTILLALIGAGVVVAFYAYKKSKKYSY